MNGETSSPFSGINNLIEEALRPIGKPLGQLFGGAAGGLANLVAPSYADMVREQFTHAGESTPRFLAEAMLYGAKRAPLKALGLGDVALRSSQVPGADIGSTLAHTAAFATAPAIGGAAERMVEPLSEHVAGKFAGPAGKFLAGQAIRRPASVAGSLVPFEAASALEQYRHGETYNPFTPENIVGTAASVLPFEAAGIPGLAKEYNKLVNEVPVTDQADVWRVHYTAHDEDKQREFLDKQSAFDFADQLRKTLRIEPQVEQAGTMPRQWVQRSMAWSPKQLQGNLFGLKTSEVLNTLGDKEMPGTQMLGTLKNKVSKGEWEALPGFEEFLKGQKTVHPQVVQDWLDQNAPRVEIRKAGQGSLHPDQRAYLDLQHNWADRQDQRTKEVLNDFVSGAITSEEIAHFNPDSGFLANAQKLYDLFQKSKTVPYNPQEAHWQSVSPKPENEMEGYVEGAVVAPGKHVVGVTSPHMPESGVDDLFPASHNFPPNTLGWFRGYMETDPQGKKTFHIVEVQSDWAKRVRDIKEKVPVEYQGMYNRTPEQELQRISHPLLPQWERLTLKAAIDHAIKNSADRIAVSDAETAMMTEGQDLTVAPSSVSFPNKVDAEASITRAKQQGVEGPFYIKKTTDGWQVVQEPEQAPGMRLHYDNTFSITDKKGNRLATESFPDAESAHAFAKNRTAGLGLREGSYEVHQGSLNEILRELTGEKGEQVAFGEHKMAFDPSIPGRPDLRTTRPNLIFREPSGEPKTSITAQSYDLSKTKSELAKRGGFPMFGGEQFVKSHIEKMMSEGYQPDEIVRALDNVKMLSPLKGETPLQTLARSVGMDPRLFATLPPGEALPRALEFLTSVFHYNYGQPLDRAAYLARQTALPLARFAPFLKQTQFALAPFGEFANRFYGVKEPKSDLFKYLISVSERDVMFHSQQSLTFDIAYALGHESMHNAVAEAMNPVGDVDPRTRRAVIRALANVEAIPPNERRDVMLSMLRMVVPKSRWAEADKINFDNHKTSPEEFLADFAAVLSVGSTKAESVKNLKDAMFFGDRASQQFSQAVYRDLTSAWSGAKDFLSLPGVSSHESKQIVKLVNGVYGNLTKIMQSVEEAERTLDTFQGFMERLQAGPLDPPPVVTQRQMHTMFSKLDDLEKGVHPRYLQASQELTDEAVASVRPYEVPEKVAGERLGFWRDYFKPMSQLVESLKDKVQSAIPVKALGFEYRSMVSTSQQMAWSNWADDNGKVDWQRLRWLGKDGTTQERAFSTIALVENVRTQKENADEMLTREQREALSPEYKALSNEDKDKVDTSLIQASAMTRFLARQRWNAHRDRVSWEMSKIIMSYNKSLYHDQAKNYANDAVHYFFDTPKDVEEFQAFFNAREKFLASLPLPDKGKQDLEAAVRSNLEPWQRLGDALLGKEDPTTGERPGKTFYLPEVRVREWHVAWKMTGEDVPHHEAFKTEAQAAKKLADVRKTEGLDWVKSFNRKDRTDRFRGAVQEEISSAQQDALDALKASVLSRISSEHPEAQDIIRRIDSEFQPATAFQQVTVSPYMREREFIPGRENLNMVEGLVRYIDASSYEMAKRHVKQAGQVVLFNPDMRENPNIRNSFEKYLRFVTDAEGREFNGLKNLVFFHYLGLNPVQILVEPTQQLLSLVPYLVENGMPVGEAYSALRKANRDILKSWTKGTLDDPREDQALQRAILKRTVDTGFVSDLYGETDLDFAVERTAFAGNDKLQDKLDLVRRPLYQLLAAARHLYGKTTPALNGKVAFLTAFRHEWSRSHNYEKAEAFATQATDATMFGGGRAARPMVLQRFGSMSGVGGLMYTLGSYTFNTIAMMGRLGRKAIVDSSLQPHEKVAAQKAFGLMLGTQLAMGGLLGLPLVAAGMAVLEQIFPGLDLRKNARQAFVNLAGDDEDMGHMVADAALRGVMNLTPVDFGSRFQLANMLGVSPYDGFSWSNLAGPASNMLENYVKATGQAATGQFGEAARTAAPSSIKQILQLVHDDYDIRDKAGRMISEMSPAEKVLATLGFKPKRLTQYYEEQSIRERTEANQSRIVRDIRSDAAKALVKGDPVTARQTILQGTKEAGPYDPLDMAREAAQLAVEMQSPTLRRQGTRALAESEAEISRLYPRGTPISEVARVLRQAQLVRQMGLQFGKPSLEQLRMAKIVDNLMQADPKLTLMQARLKAEQIMSPGARRRSSLSTLLQAQP